MILLVAATLSIITLTIIVITVTLTRTKPSSPPKTLIPPGPPGLPLLGNLHQFMAAANKPHIHLWHLSQKYGPIMQMKQGQTPLLVISSPKLAKEALKTQELSFSSRPRLLGQSKLSYGCLDIAFAPYGNHWREMRKISIVHLLSLKKTKSFRSVREDEVFLMVNRLSELASLGEAVNLSEMAMSLFSNLICRVTFGEGCESRRFDDLLHEAQAMMAAFFVSDHFPWFGWIDRLSGLMDRLERTFEKLDGFYQEIIDKHLDPDRVKKIGEEIDVLDVLIRLKENESCSVDLSWDCIKALIMNFFVAGTDTNSASTVWTMTALLKAPRVMKKLQREIRDSLGQKSLVDEDDIEKLPYLKAVVSESLRLYPPAPLLVPRETIAKCTLDGYEIEPKTIVYVNAWAIARDPEYWESPHEFKPERFLNNNVSVRGQDFGVIPFGSGRRICPGMSMGLANVELTVANLVYAFDWDLPPGVKPESVDEDSLPGLAMHKKNPLLVVPKKPSISVGRD
ncbi:6,7,8-trihydroxycoumarin synthase-like [Andrographis paniculata]|uniref:6,7,8-trihydroxycoumarin synthase-like n=1 Tax=Andrographis paniculata TaxID=175694 RepID=UPI0021E78FF7|nr:6,7,8-trihydroxycoumarin synthase-like [Andrographis paniculata]